ncbi:hypothetical protein PAPYR_10540 [Paratrimastix pyriformis]|uniref:Uncharacterized protein n=1 Tax=Paratrimastix pyriformis TaxID=342808 RepID=A0ABQ8UCW3_9EUKA|nr:hypothetical protein PAPYR_10540 [Paratrimastix pyriformis]
MPPDSLLDRLEHLELSAQPDFIFESVCIASKRLRSLCLHLTVGHSATVTLDCPALETITGLPQEKSELEEEDEPYDLVLECPRLRSVQGLPATVTVQLPPVMPDLVLVEAAEAPCCESAWLPQLLAAALRLREARLREVCLGSGETLAQLLASRTLTHLQLTLGDGALPASNIRKGGKLVLPAQLTHADIKMPTGGSLAQQIVAQGLRNLRLHGGSAVSSRVTIICPALTTLTIDLGGRVAFVVAKGAPRFFELGCCDEAVGSSLVAFLSSTGGAAARLRRVVLRQIVPDPRWPQVMAALAGLPLLASLVLTDTGGSQASTDIPFSLSSPSLRHLFIRNLQVSALELNCPLLEELWTPFEHICRFALTGPAPRQGTMRRIGHIRPGTWAAKEMGRRFPGALLWGRHGRL